MLAGLSLAGTTPVVAQQAAPRTDTAQSGQAEASGLDDGESIVVNGRRQPGEVIGDIKPVQQYNSGDIRALGVSSVAELLTELAPQTRSDRGRGGDGPVTLLNGRRISGFAEIRDIPAEAIVRVDILPEEAALKYGYSADQKVVNIVLRPRFRAVTGELEGGMTTKGDGDTTSSEINLLRIQRDQRINFNAEYQTSDALTEKDRNLTPRNGSSSDVSRYRTIRPDTQSLALNSVYSRNVLGNVAATLNATLDVTDSDSLQGLTSGAINRPKTQSVDGITGHIGFTLDKDIGKWRTSLTGGYDHGDNRTRTLRNYNIAGGALIDNAKALTNTGNVQFVTAGPLATLPAGPITASVKAGATALGLDATSTRSGLATSSDLSRTDLNGRVSLDLPLTSRREGVLEAIGDLSVNANGAFDKYSDFGTLGAWGYGANWTPRTGIGLLYSFTEDRSPPTVQQLGNPLVTTPGVTTYDYLNGTTVDITQLGGGNAALKADRRRVTKIGLTLKPFKADITFTADYVDSKTRNAIASFPEPTAAIEAAFPDRFTRDGDGNLLSIDARPINFARQDRSELRWGFNFTQRLKTSQALIDAMRNSPRLKALVAQREAAAAARDAATKATQQQGTTPQPPASQAGSATPGGGRAGGQGGPGGFGGPGRGGPGGFGGAAGGGRIQLAFYHTWHFKDEVLIRQGLPVLDLIKGDTIGSGGGTSRHELEAQLGYANNGIGARLTGNWKSATDVTGTPGSPTGDLHFSPLTTLNARLFVNLMQIPAFMEYGWAQGTRLSLRVDNLLDTHPRVRDATGATPLRYQAGYLDPSGRTIRLQIRKLFF